MVFPVLACLLAALYFVQAYSASLIKSPTSDEPPHIAAAVSYFGTGRVAVNLQHPPLLKELSGLFLRLGGGIPWPDTEFSQELLKGNSVLEWPVGNSILHDNGVGKVLYWARLPFLLLGLLMAGVLYLWGSRLAGPIAAVGAVALYALDPTILAHSQLVTTDCGFATFSTLYLLMLWLYLRQPTPPRLLVCGLALGAALAAKFSAVILLPVTGILLLASLRWPVTAQAASVAIPAAAPAGLSRNAPCPCGSGRKLKSCHGAEGVRSGWLAGLHPGPRPTVTWCVKAFLAMFAVAVVVIQVVYLFSRGPFAYLEGYRLVNADHNADFLAYMGGRLEPRFLTYYAVAYLLKQPLAAILLASLGLAVLWRDRRIGMLDRLFLLLPPAVFFAGYSLMSDNLGVRYIIPALPFTYLLGGIGLAWLVRGGLWQRAAAAVLGLWLVVAAAGIYPDHLAYFNEMACLLDEPAHLGWDGGTRCGPTWLADSNVDWGQGLGQLKTWLNQHAPGRPVRMAYFGIFPPIGYGIQWQKLETPELQPDPEPGLYVVTAHQVAFAPAWGRQLGNGGAAWLKTRPPTAIVGHSYYIYDVREDASKARSNP
jgi:hypothetical protein